MDVLCFGILSKDTSRYPKPEFGAFEPEDLTGAGDYFRAGLYAAVVKNTASFKDGSFDFRQGGLEGHRVASRCLRSKPVDDHLHLD